MNMIRKGRVRWLDKADAVGQALFIGAFVGTRYLIRIHPSTDFHCLSRLLPELRNETRTRSKTAECRPLLSHSRFATWSNIGDHLIAIGSPPLKPIDCW
jgi:hypothetical protein